MATAVVDLPIGARDLNRGRHGPDHRPAPRRRL